MSTPEQAASRSTWRDVDYHWSGWVLLAAVMTAMLAWTWRTWPDPIIDFGRELYVPWQISEGRDLYTEIAYHNGPLSPNLNALWFSIFGVSLSALLLLNGLIVVGVTALLRLLLRDITGPGGATAGCVAFLSLCAFGQYVAYSNYNWMCPYSHEMTHGIALSLLALRFLRGFARSERRGYAAAAGATLGLVFLTKAEVFVAGAGGVGTGLLFALRVRGLALGRSVAVCGLTAGCALLPPIVAFALLRAEIPTPDALLGTIGTWAYVFDDTLAEQAFFTQISGFDEIGGNSLRILIIALVWAAVLLPSALAARFVTGAGRRQWQRTTAIALLLAYVGAAFWFGAEFPVFDWLRPLPVILLAWFAVADVRTLVRPRGAGQLAGTSVLRPAFLVFSGLLLIKILLAARVAHYGFGLAMPGTALLIAGLVGSMPEFATRWRFSSAVVRASTLGVCLGVIGCHLAVVHLELTPKVHRVGSHADHFYAGPPGLYMERALGWIAQNTTADATLTTMVDCEMLNYLSRRRNPIRYGNFNPQQLHLFGEENIRAALDAAKPDVIALVHRDTAEYGPQFFGRDYGRSLSQWIARHYSPILPPIGAVPFRSDRGGIMFFRRN